MIIDFISDTHLNYDHLEGKLTGDTLVHCGDWSEEGEKGDTETFIEWLASQPHEHKVIVPGNHERFIHELYKDGISPGYIIQDIYESITYDGDNLHFLLDSSTTIDGIKFYGMPWVQYYPNWGFSYKDSDHKLEMSNKIPMDTDILMTHEPPFGILDETILGKEKFGCAYLRDRVDKVKPTVHAFGHIHRPGGETYNNGHTLFLNCATNHVQVEVESSLSVTNVTGGKHDS